MYVCTHCAYISRTSMYYYAYIMLCLFFTSFQFIVGFCTIYVRTVASTCVRMYVRTCMYVCMYVRMCVHTCKYVCMHHLKCPGQHSVCPPLPIQPTHYIAHLIGHEGPGSVLSVLKVRGQFSNRISCIWLSYGFIPPTYVCVHIFCM